MCNPYGFGRGPILEEHQGVRLEIHKYSHASATLRRPVDGEEPRVFARRVLASLDDDWVICALWRVRPYRYELIDTFVHPENGDRRSSSDMRVKIADKVRTSEIRLNKGYTWDTDGGGSGGGFFKKPDRYADFEGAQ